MAVASTIEWTEATWNPVVGCQKVSAGCKNCYAERMAKRLAAMAAAEIERGNDPGKKGTYLEVIDQRGHWSGNVAIDPASLEIPLTWKSPRTIFVNSMSDLFHADVPESFIQSVFEVMNRCPQHTFQVLTKRPERTRMLSSKLSWGDHVWMGTSVENEEVVHRVHELQQTGAKVKFLSVEPLLGPIARLPLNGIDWVIVGGESGPGARIMKPAWVEQIKDRCAKYRVAFFFKQWGGVSKKKAGRLLSGRTWDEMPLRRPVAIAG